MSVGCALRCLRLGPRRRLDFSHMRRLQGSLFGVSTGAQVTAQALESLGVPGPQPSDLLGMPGPLGFQPLGISEAKVLCRRRRLLKPFALLIELAAKFTLPARQGGLQPLPRRLELSRKLFFVHLSLAREFCLENFKSGVRLRCQLTKLSTPLRFHLLHFRLKATLCGNFRLAPLSANSLCLLYRVLALPLPPLGTAFCCSQGLSQRLTLSSKFVGVSFELCCVARPSPSFLRQLLLELLNNVLRNFSVACGCFGCSC
mmetsp:Transcript_21027/g.43104  ORF Transcript_21027/g.43104 Transcript_21027/m.43104 type:complete len:258 (-) Transcript_21027:229-1002(-)